ncbi:hypothetical protein BD410DRAFT_881969 [Rickenella mellea]|uniref:Uncharacterized protein n=1 Tax=Rickenella mellea TaxID=50990 RepID=A0A4Y7QH30_9AGAM|nr:hypothetical protein BD410DRAFT_881969 [Rickenella mellea]
MLNFYLDPELNYTWTQSSVLAAKAAGKGANNHARNLRCWVVEFVQSGTLPQNRYGRFNTSLLEDEDLAQQIHLHLQGITKEGYIRAQDVVDFMATEPMKRYLGTKTGISLRTAQRWMKKMSWRWKKAGNGMYRDGHDRDDVVKYREGFIQRMASYSKRMVTYDKDGNIASNPTDVDIAAGKHPLILVTHDESTFYANDRRKTKWEHADSMRPEPKGEGASLMVSDFLTTKWGRLVHNEQYVHHLSRAINYLQSVLILREARILFKAGKNRDGYFNNDQLVEQVENAMDIFEERTNGEARGLFLFDNATTHQKRPPDGLSAQNMTKGSKLGWTHIKGGPKMRHGTMPNGERQDFYYPLDHETKPGWFKGMEVILRERGLWRDGLLAQCKDFKCKDGATDCCCRRTLFNQPDFWSAKSHLEEVITARGHECDFYPKFHCELNFIEQYWGAAKLRYRLTPRTQTFDAMQKNVVACLDDVPLIQIRRYANRSARFMDAYAKGLSSSQAAWATKKYHGHRVLPNTIMDELEKAGKA